MIKLNSYKSNKKTEQLYVKTIGYYLKTLCKFFDPEFNTVV